MPNAPVTTRSKSRWLGPAFRGTPRRLVSLVPSLTHAVFELGAGPLLVGRTGFCVRPAEGTGRVEAVGGTKNPDVDRIIALEPDLVLANREENTRPRIEHIASRVPVLLTDPGSPEDVPALWRELGAVCGRDAEAERRAREVEEELGRWAGQPAPASPRFVYWIWRDPWMAAGHDTYVSRLLTAAGWTNALPSRCRRYPRVDPAEPIGWAHTTLLFASEPYPFRMPRDLEAFPGRAFKDGPGRWRLEAGTVALEVDGQVLSWYPSLTLEGLRTAAALRRSV
jgi:iron complex transport system substrate-binding protein